MTEGQGGADNGDEHIAEVREVAVDRHHDVGDAVGAAGRRAQLLIDGLEVADGLLLAAEYFHDFLTRHHLLDEAVDAAEALLLGAEIGTRPLAELRGGDHHDGGNQTADNGQRHAEDYHRGQRHADGDDGIEHLCQSRRNHLAQRVHVVGIDGHDVAVLPLVEVADGQPLHTLEKLLAQFQLGTLRHVDHQAVVEIGADDAEQQDEAELEEYLGQRMVFRIVRLRQRHDIVVNQGTREERRGERRDGGDDDTDEHHADAELIVLQHHTRHAPDDVAGILVYPLEACLSM